MGNNPSRFQGPTRPVENVSWHDAQDFLARINARIPGLDLMLPSEAHWGTCLPGGHRDGDLHWRP